MLKTIQHAHDNTVENVQKRIGDQNGPPLQKLSLLTIIMSGYLDIKIVLKQPQKRHITLRSFPYIISFRFLPISIPLHRSKKSV